MCRNELLNAVQILWGASGQVYDLGDRVRWFQKRGEILSPNSYFNSYLNLGDPIFPIVYVFDQIEYYPQGGGRCHHCEQAIGGVAAKLKDGVFEKILVFDQAEIDRLFGANDRESETLVNCGNTLVPYHFPDHFSYVALGDDSGVTLEPVLPGPAGLRIDLDD